MGNYFDPALIGDFQRECSGRWARFKAKLDRQVSSDMSRGISVHVFHRSFHVTREGWNAERFCAAECHIPISSFKIARRVNANAR